MELYYAPMACSLASRIALAESGSTAALHRVDLATKRIADGRDLHAINPMGQVPTLVLDDGRLVTENVAVLIELAGDRRDRELVRWLSFVATELHKTINAPLFTRGTPEAVKAHARAAAAKPLAVLESIVATRDVLAGDAFSVADAYAVWALAIMPFGGVALDAYPAVLAYRDRHLARPSVASAFAIERAEYA